jgi:exosortase H (IPTLxxWG-CTERM-specific)
MPAAPSRTRKRSGTFLLLFVLAALVQFAILLAAPIRPWVDGFSANLASFSAWLISTCGGTCFHHAAVLSNPARGFSMEIRDGCNGINVVILLWAAMIAYPSSLKWKLAGLGGGLAAIQVLNLFRLISLYYLGQYSYAVFEFAHLYLWEMLIIIDAIVVFHLWSKGTVLR